MAKEIEISSMAFKSTQYSENKLSITGLMNVFKLCDVINIYWTHDGVKIPEETQTIDIDKPGQYDVYFTARYSETGECNSYFTSLYIRSDEPDE